MELLKSHRKQTGPHGIVSDLELDQCTDEAHRAPRYKHALQVQLRTVEPDQGLLSPPMLSNSRYTGGSNDRGRIGSTGSPFAVGEFVAHDSRLRFGSLNHVPGDAINPRQTGCVSSI